MTKDRNTFRIYDVRDSNIYRWLIDNPKDTLLKIEDDRSVNEGKYFNSDLIMIGINDDEVKKLERVESDNNKVVLNLINTILRRQEVVFYASSRYYPSPTENIIAEIE